MLSNMGATSHMGLFKCKLLKIKNIAGQVSKGVISSIFDVATLGYGSDLYKKFVGNTTGEEKIKRNLHSWMSTWSSASKPF